MGDQYGFADLGEYRPDPEAENQALIEAFFTALADALPQDDGLISRIRARHERLVAEQGHWFVDEASRHNLALTLAVLAAYRELAALMGDDESLPLIRTAFIEPFGPMITDATRAALDASPDPFATMVDISRRRERDFFGAAFVFTHPEDEQDRYTALVQRCFYNDVLVANGAAHLMPIMCDFDANWINGIEPDRHGFTFERPATIGTGGSTCPFRFRRTRER
ncbi:L-2-amino-thiazoline-4-carboxylic acid hydrolase [Thermopolyspora sp. NPDC052614]|uniref:L-2-amino-thiazoline-4-carboxylic acid hydrolase n=1 Tax=Thermopolyspora sp. NPDC052614 TaxID=3155682 RepID=UPI00342D475B